MIDRQTQIAALLKLLGDDAAAAVLEHLPDDLAELLRSRMADETTEDVELQQKRDLLKDFESFFDFALESQPAQLQVFDDPEEPEEETTDEEPQEEEENEPEEIVLTGDPMVDLERLSVHQLAGALETEQPRTVAILLNSIEPQLAAQVLSFFPEEHRLLVVRQLSKEQNAPQLLVERIARATVQRGITLPPDAPDRRDHIDRLSEVLREVPKSYRRDMLASVEEEDAELSATLLKKLYRFDDIVNLEPQVVQQVLGEIDATTLTTAMFEADQSVVDAILGNLSRRARQTIEEELKFQTRVSPSKVEEARSSVAELIAKIDQEE